jgi:hypothetical protein
MSMAHLKGVLANAKIHIDSNDEHTAFMGRVDNPRIRQYGRRLQHKVSGNASMQQKYEKNMPLLSYLFNTWILYKENFVAAWTRQYTHLGSSTTSRVDIQSPSHA